MAGGLADAVTPPGGGMNGAGKADTGGYGGGELLIPPLNFAMVTPGVYRSGACWRFVQQGGRGGWKGLAGCLRDAYFSVFRFSESSAVEQGL